MKSILTIYIIETGCSLGCVIREFDEKLRIGDPAFSFSTLTGFTIRSYQYPEINKTSIFLPGSEKIMDDKVFVATSWGETLQEFKDRIISALHETIWVMRGIDTGVYFCRDGIGDVFSFYEFTGHSPSFTVE